MPYNGAPPHPYRTSVLVTPVTHEIVYGVDLATYMYILASLFARLMFAGIYINFTDINFPRFNLVTSSMLPRTPSTRHFKLLFVEFEITGFNCTYFLVQQIRCLPYQSSYSLFKAKSRFHRQLLRLIKC